MQSFIITLLICSVTMSALALFYMAITPLLAKRYSVKSRYYAWLVIVLGFIIPFRPHFDNPMVKVDIPSQTLSPVVQIGNGTPFAIPAQDTLLPTALPSISLWQIIMIVWLVGMLAVFAYYVIKHYRFMKMVRRWSETVVDEQVMALVQDLTSELKINRQIDFEVCSCIGSPILVGFIKPKILIPQLNFAKDELRFILKHELVHFKRKDLWYKCFVLVATAIHWFNPIVCLMAKAINVQCELSCDAEVVQSTNQDTRLHYSETIIGVIKYHSKLNTALSTNFYGGKKGMKKRIFSIMDMSKKKAGLAVVCCALIVTLGTGAAFAASASGQNSSSSSAYSDNNTPSVQELNKIDKQNRENIASQYVIYEKYGLTYNPKTDAFSYDGKTVRFFADKLNSEGANITFTRANGKIDIRAIRNAKNELAGIKIVSQEEFDSRTKSFESIKDMQGTAQEGNSANDKQTLQNGSATQVDESISTRSGSATEAGDPNYQDTSLNAYLSYGVSYDKTNKCWVYENKPIHYFSDGDYITLVDNSDYAVKNGLSLEVVRGTNGKIEKIVKVV